MAEPDKKNNGTSALDRTIWKITLALATAFFIAVGAMVYNAALDIAVIRTDLTHFKEIHKKTSEQVEENRSDIEFMRLEWKETRKQ